jgi:D-sedoheptulose 7-phosphate isomerase
VYARQLEGLARPRDVAVGISTSGNAANVIHALLRANRMGMTTVAMTGAGGGRVRDLVNYWVAVPSNDVARIQECHIMIGHIWSELVEAALFGEQAAGDQPAGDQPAEANLPGEAVANR